MGFTQLDKNKNDIMADAGEEAVARRQAAAGGRIRANDAMEPEARTGPRPYQAAVITLSDQGARGEREDLSGPAIVRRLAAAGYEIVETLLLPDGEHPLSEQLLRLCDQRRLDLILTTGGTGFTPGIRRLRSRCPWRNGRRRALPRPSAPTPCGSPGAPCSRGA